MLKNLLILSSLLLLTACQSVPVKTAEVKKTELTIPKVIIDSDNDGVPDDSAQCLDTPLNVVVDKKGCPVSLTDEPPAYNELKFNYKKDSAFPDGQYIPELERAIEKMKEYPKSIATIEGHASKAEKDPEKISRERAIIIAQILKEKFGINENRISINSYGTERPVATNKTQEGRNRNQRVYMIISHLSN